MDDAELRRKSAQALAKVLAYRACGKDKDAEDWLRYLVHLLRSPQLAKD